MVEQVFVIVGVSEQLRSTLGRCFCLGRRHSASLCSTHVKRKIFHACRPVCWLAAASRLVS